MNRTKKAICDAFWELLEEKPYNKITVHDIVERCQVNRNTFYYHFQDIPALTEYTISEWADEIIKNHCESGSPINCIKLIAEECIRRKRAFLHLYRSVNNEAFMRHLNKIDYHIVRSYIKQITDGLENPPENQEIMIRYYKCVFTGILLDWFDSDLSYDLIEFLEDIYKSFKGFLDKGVFKRL